MAPASTYQSGLQNLQIGTERYTTHKGSNGPTMVEGRGWDIPTGSYTARQIVEANAPLLENVLHHLGPTVVDGVKPRDMLLDNLLANLSLGNRISSITIPIKDTGSAEMAAQAEKIGKTLIDYARNVTNAPYIPEFYIRSPCEGHLLKHPVAALMFGPRSLEHLLQVYNEYLHQMVLLRDSLLPFENYEEVIIPINNVPGCKRGLRHMEESRSLFLAELVTKAISQGAVLKFAKSLLTTDLSTDNAYGFQYEHGLILPSFLVGSSSYRLLRFIPAVMDQSIAQVAFQYQERDYYSAPRTEITPVDETAAAGDSLLASSIQPNEIKHAELTLITPSKAIGTTGRHLMLTIERSSADSASIDLGQIARGRRYAYPVGNLHGAVPNQTSSLLINIHSAWKVLTESGPGLVTARDGIHLIKAGSNIELLALLGKIYPENVAVVKKGESLAAALATAKGLPGKGRFILQSEEDCEAIMPRRCLN